MEDTLLVVNVGTQPEAPSPRLTCSVLFQQCESWSHACEEDSTCFEFGLWSGGQLERRRIAPGEHRSAAMAALVLRESVQAELSVFTPSQM